MAEGPDFATARDVALRTVAAEFGCSPEALDEPGVRVVERPDPERVALRRRYPACDPSVDAASFGAGTLLSTSPGLRAQVTRLAAGTNGNRVFDAPFVVALSALVEPAGFVCHGPVPRLLCGTDTLVERDAPPGVRLELEIDPPPERADALGRSRWPNALGSGPHPERPQRAVVVALDGERELGVASMGADSEQLWQIGLDVVPEARGRGIGAALGALLAGEALARGAVPFWGASPANVASLRTAAAAGFQLAWVELTTRLPPQAPDEPVR